MKTIELQLWTIILLLVLVLGNVEEDAFLSFIWFTFGAFLSVVLLVKIFADALGLQITVKK